MADQFEYKIVTVDYYYQPMALDLTVKDFNELGKEGWILTQYHKGEAPHSSEYIFYRKINNESL